MGALPWVLLVVCLVAWFFQAGKAAEDTYQLRKALYDMTLWGTEEVLIGIADYVPTEHFVDDPDLKGNSYFNYTMGELVAHAKSLRNRLNELPEFDDTVSGKEFDGFMAEFTEFKTAFDSMQTT